MFSYDSDDPGRASLLVELEEGEKEAETLFMFDYFLLPTWVFKAAARLSRSVREAIGDESDMAFFDDLIASRKGKQPREGDDCADLVDGLLLERRRLQQKGEADCSFLTDGCLRTILFEGYFGESTVEAPDVARVHWTVCPVFLQRESKRRPRLWASSCSSLSSTQMFKRSAGSKSKR